MSDGRTLQIKVLREGISVPKYATEDSAGLDLVSAETCTVQPGSNHLFKTGLAMAIPRGFFGAIYPRSGMAVKKGMRLSNCVGVVDPDYRGEVMVSLYNDSSENVEILEGDRIAQMIIQPYDKCEIIECDELSDTERGSGGFGSTGR